MALSFMSSELFKEGGAVKFTLTFPFKTHLVGLGKDSVSFKFDM